MLNWIEIWGIWKPGHHLELFILFLKPSRPRDAKENGAHQTKRPSHCSKVQFWHLCAYRRCFSQWTGVIIGTLIGLRLCSSISSNLLWHIPPKAIIKLCVTCATVDLLLAQTRRDSLRCPRADDPWVPNTLSLVCGLSLLGLLLVKYSGATRFRDTLDSLFAIEYWRYSPLFTGPQSNEITAWTQNL